MRLERQKYLGVAPYERSSKRQGHANGFKPHTAKTRVGEITLAVPQVREGGFFPQALEKGLRSERALTLALAEMYVQGVSTRDVTAIIEKLCGSSVSSSHAKSRATQQLDETLTAWRQRPLGEIAYLFLDARYERVRRDGQICDAAILIVIGVDASGHRRVLGVSVSLGEHEVHWRIFMQSLVERGLRGVQLIVSDSHAGLRPGRPTRNTLPFRPVPRRRGGCGKVGNCVEERSSCPLFHSPNSHLVSLPRRLHQTFYRSKFALSPILVLQIGYLALALVSGLALLKQRGVYRRWLATILLFCAYFWVMTTSALSIVRYMVPAMGLYGAGISVVSGPHRQKGPYNVRSHYAFSNHTGLQRRRHDPGNRAQGDRSRLHQGGYRRQRLFHRRHSCEPG